MATRRNPLALNPLQLKTLTLFQALARSGQPSGDKGDILISALPHPHGDHFHLGDAVVATRDATGLGNAGVWAALERKGLIRSRFPDALILTAAGDRYETGMAGDILHSPDH